MDSELGAFLVAVAFLLLLGAAACAAGGFEERRDLIGGRGVGWPEVIGCVVFGDVWVGDTAGEKVVR